MREAFSAYHAIPMALSRCEAAANLAALALPDGWTRADDVALMEGVFRGLPMAALAVGMGRPVETVRGRFFALQKAVTGGGVFGVTAQVMLLELVREVAA